MKQGQIRFCGGCNPRFDRGQAYNTIKTALQDCIAFPHTSEPADVLLVIRGCTACPYELEQFSAKQRIILSSVDEIDDVIAQIRSFCTHSL